MPTKPRRALLALADPKVAAMVDGKTLKKLVYVRGRILNFIV